MAAEPEDRSLLAELKRRRVVRLLVGYGAGAFAVIQVGDVVLPVLGVPDPVFRAVVVAVLVGFPIVFAAGWLLERGPDGLRLTDDRRAALKRLPVLLLAGCVGAALFGLVLLGVRLVRPHVARAGVARAAEVIAVLPFHVSGSDLDVMSEGMVDLLSRNLDEVGAIRTVDPRTVLYRWQEASGGRRLPLEGGLAVGRKVGAGSVIGGSILAVGPRVRLDAELIAVDGEELARAEVEGSRSSILALVDSLSVALVREIWRSRRPAPNLRVAAVTSGDLEAIRAFLKGERHYRESRWDSAMADFRVAVERDSLFALAWYRIANTAGWGQGTVNREALARDASARAAALADRLPARERALVEATRLRAEGEIERSAEVLRDHLSRYPEDAEARYFLADDVYHERFENTGPLRPAASVRVAGFDSVLAFDPSFTPALIHPFEVAFEVEDADLVARYLDLLRASPNPDSLAISVYGAGLRALRSPDSGDAVAGALGAAHGALDSGLGSLAWQAARAIRPAMLRITARLPAAPRQTVLGGLRRASGDAATDGQAAEALAIALQTGGRPEEAAMWLARVADGPLGREEAEDQRAVAVWAGLADTATVADLDTRGGVRLASRLFRAWDAADRAELHGAVAGVASRAAEPGASAGWRRFLEAARAFEGEGSRGAAGPATTDTEALAEALEGTWPQAGSLWEPLWFRWAVALALAPSSRDRGIEALRRPWPGDARYEIGRLAALTLALEARGAAAEADVSRRRLAAALAAAEPTWRLPGWARAALTPPGSTGAGPGSR